MMIVGIDVSKASLDAAWGTDDATEHQAFAYTEQGMKALLQATPSATCYVMEATGTYHLRLALYLHQQGRSVSVVNPLIIKRFSQMRLSQVKSDQADAQLIQAYARLHKPPRWSPAPEAVLELETAHHWLNSLIQERTRLVNQQEARAQQPHTSAFVEAHVAEQKAQLAQRIQEGERYLEQLVKKSFAALYVRLQTIPGMGKKTAIQLIIITRGFERFSNVKALCAYVGISPTTYCSGTSVRTRGGIAKRGQGRMRQLLYLCSWTAKSCNAGCRILYERMQAAGKPRKVMNIALAHKLLRQAYGIAHSGENYSPQFA